MMRVTKVVKRGMAPVKCPNLSRLPLVNVGAYTPSDVPWDDRTELVVGGCRPDEHDTQMTKCYGDWSAAMLGHVLENPQANTIVLLSVGAGVLELRTLKTIFKLLGDGTTEVPIDKVVLIDPFLHQNDPFEARMEAATVVSEYRGHLGSEVDVEYHIGPNAYTDAIAGLHFDKTRVVAVVGALNMSFGLLSSHRSNLRGHLAPRNLVSEAMRRNPNLYVVQSFLDSGVATVRDEETAEAFLARERKKTQLYERIANGGPVTAEERIERLNLLDGF
tara:strand:+ start:34 stop:858 length:825 start_codon:yes stop_codon:yes gene_type:complete